MNLIHVLKTPLITEKTIKDATSGVYTFAVDNLASKNQIKQAIEVGFGVTVTRVRTLKHKGKSYRVGRTRTIRLKPDQKIAKVILKPGQTIDLFEIEETK